MKDRTAARADKVVSALASDIALRRAVYYMSPTFTVKATRQRRVDRRSRQETFLLTFGSPNYAERAFIKACKEAGEQFPVKKVQLKFWPKKKVKK